MSDEREYAEKFALKLFPTQKSPYAEAAREGVVQGYLVGRASAISEGLSADEAMSVVIAVQAERERSAKLIKLLEMAIEVWPQKGDHLRGIVNLMRNAIAEYEGSSRDGE